MKTPRHEQPWYESRLLNNKKPSPITEEERTSITDENRRLIEESASIIATGVKRGWISFPAKTEAETWVPSPTGLQPPDPLSMIWPES
jgi:hypothetical protein